MQIIIDIDDRIYSSLKYFEESLGLNDKKNNNDNVKTALVQAVVHGTPIKHLGLHSSFSMQELAQMPRNVFSSLLINNMSKAFAGAIKDLPIKTEYIEQFDMYKATLDLWVKPKDVLDSVEEDKDKCNSMEEKSED